MVYKFRQKLALKIERKTGSKNRTKRQTLSYCAEACNTAEKFDRPAELVLEFFQVAEV